MPIDPIHRAGVGGNSPSPVDGRVKVIACEVMFREICRVAAESRHTVDVEFMPKGLHDLPSSALRSRLQCGIDTADDGSYDRIALAYGLCSNGLVGLQARRTPLVVPRAHDCITLFLGSRERYRRFFESHPGCYVLTSGWIERGECDEELRAASIQGRAGLLASYEEWVEAYGRDNADYLRATLHTASEATYDRYAFIRMGVEPDDRFEREARQRAEKKGWTFSRLRGDMGLLRRLVDGPWDEDDFLCVPPGSHIEADVLGEIMRAVPGAGEAERKPKP